MTQVRTELAVYVKQKTDEILNLNNQVRVLTGAGVQVCSKVQGVVCLHGVGLVKMAVGVLGVGQCALGQCKPSGEAGEAARLIWERAPPANPTRTAASSCMARAPAIYTELLSAPYLQLPHRPLPPTQIACQYCILRAARRRTQQRTATQT